MESEFEALIAHLLLIAGTGLGNAKWFGRDGHRVAMLENSSRSAPAAPPVSKIDHGEDHARQQEKLDPGNGSAPTEHV